MFSRKDIIRVRRILQKMKYHDGVMYEGPIVFLGSSKVISQDYSFRDKYYDDWDSERAYIPNSKIRNQMESIIQILEKCRKNERHFLITKFIFKHI